MSCSEPYVFLTCGLYFFRPMLAMPFVVVLWRWMALRAQASHQGSCRPHYSPVEPIPRPTTQPRSGCAIQCEE
eukprot:8355976-Alexandrium_andersonii.AAC.1